jgi:hypothetical protein
MNKHHAATLEELKGHEIDLFLSDKNILVADTEIKNDKERKMNTRTDLETLKKINFVTSLNIPDKDFKRAEKILGICKSLNEEIKGEGELEGAIGVYIKVGEQFFRNSSKLSSKCRK